MKRSRGWAAACIDRYLNAWRFAIVDDSYYLASPTDLLTLFSKRQ